MTSEGASELIVLAIKVDDPALADRLFDSYIDLAPAKTAPCTPDERDCTECSDRGSMLRADGTCESTGHHGCGFKRDRWEIGTINS